MGVFSRSEDEPVKSGNFSIRNQAFAGTRKYEDWKFVHSPAGLVPPVDKSAPK